MAAQQQPQSNTDNSMAPVWITLIVIFAGYFTWKLGKYYFVSVLFFLNTIQASLINYFIHSTSLSQDIYWMKAINPSDVSWDGLVSLLESVGVYSRYPIGVILIFLAFILYQGNLRRKFRKLHDMKTLRTQEQSNWPAIMPIIKTDLVATDINKGPWAMALTPMEFARKHQLLKKEDAILDNPVRGQEMTAGIRRGDAKRVFTLQLGPYWDGFERSPPHVRALAAVFMARMHRDRKNASLILETLDKQLATGKSDYSIANKTLRQYQQTESVQKVITQHAYTLTVMASLLMASRDDGVVPSSEFLWLKPVDRRLWYMLNCVGRQTPFSEVAGPFAHWSAEKMMNRRSLVPMIDEAIKALEIAVKEVKLSPRELQELTP